METIEFELLNTNCEKTINRRQKRYYWNVRFNNKEVIISVGPTINEQIKTLKVGNKFTIKQDKIILTINDYSNECGFALGNIS